jgi:hypothetical protein
MPTPSESWRPYRRARRLLLAGFLGGLAVFAASFPVAKAFQSDKPLYVGLALFVGLAALGGTPLSGFLCPRCGKPFVHRPRLRNVFARTCVHCRLPRWEEP